MAEETKYEKLDILYNTSVRCPYCKARILKYTNTCARCGVQKQQIYYASNEKARMAMKKHTGEKVFMSYRRPNDVSFTGMVLCLFFGGWFGLHCFRVGRWLRGTLIAVLLVGGVVISGIFLGIDKSIVYDSAPQRFFRIFPTLWLFIFGFGMWVYDVCAVVFAFFKYPIRLGEAVNVGKK